MRVSDSTDSSTALADLIAGNRRFVADRGDRPNSDARRRHEVATGQAPFALILGCSDSRVPAEIVFDRGIGDLFVVRTAGHVIDDGVLGSVEFGVGVLGVPLVVVLGHDACGAVRATVDSHASGEFPTGPLRRVVDLVAPCLETSADRTSADGVIDEHALATANLLLERSPAIAERVADGRCAVVAMRYSLETGQIRVLTTLGSLTLPENTGVGTASA